MGAPRLGPHATLQPLPRLHHRALYLQTVRLIFSFPTNIAAAAALFFVLHN